MNKLSIIDATNSRNVCSCAVLANTFLSRLVGLLGKRELPEGAGLLIRPSSGVHTFGMSFPIDIVSLDKQNRVIGLFEKTGPWKVSGVSLRTHSVLELPPGRIRQCGVSIGDQLELGVASENGK
jgi:uncharacterized membrane protein (UPF0127 family)